MLYIESNNLVYANYTDLHPSGEFELLYVGFYLKLVMYNFQNPIILWVIMLTRHDRKNP